MVEQRMMAKPERAPLFERYRRTTSAWVPLPRFNEGAEPDKAE